MNEIQLDRQEDRPRPRTAKGGPILLLAITCLLVATACGCNRDTVYKTRLRDGEQIAIKTPVMLNDKPVGYVKEVVAVA